jgi:site-specific DNA-methyltransferase (adenine-specific)
MIELLNIDCMEYMATLPDKAFDLAIVDPPYGIGMDGGRIGKGKSHEQKSWDCETPNKLYFDELFRVSVSQIIWGANYMCHELPLTGAWIYWDKMQDGFGKSFSTGELAWSSFGNTMKQIRYKWQGNYCGFENAITTKSANRMQNIHPTQKPVKLYDWLLANYAEKGQRILDTHLGSGSSAIAAHYFGVDFVGCEIDEDYYNAAKHRVDMETRQMSLID